MYKYEQILFDDLINKNVKWQWVKKSTGLGITEFYLRLIVWLCINVNWREKFKNSQICIVVGPNFELGKKLIGRLRNSFSNLKLSRSRVRTLKRFMIEGSAREIIINDVTITVFPSNHIDAMRGLPNVPFVLVDEGDYFPEREQLNVLTVTTRYVAKSSSWIAMVSTPGMPNGLFDTIERDKNTPFVKYFFSYKWGMKEHGANIFTEEMIKDAQRHRPMDFEREYNLAYQGFSGNLFSVDFLYNLQKRSIYRVVDKLETYDEITKVRNVNLHVFEDFVRDENPVQYYRILSLDPGYASSKFGIVVMQINLQENKVEVIYENEFESTNSAEIVDLVSYMVKILRIRKVTVDRSDIDLIRNLKEELQDYDSVDFTELSKTELQDLIDGDMLVCPITYNNENKREMLYHLRDLMYNDFVRIDPSMKILYDALSSINVKENMTFDKKKVVGNDALDAFMGGLKLIHFDDPEY